MGVSGDVRCDACGATVEADAHRCASCGADLAGTTTPEAAVVVVAPEDPTRMLAERPAAEGPVITRAGLPTRRPTTEADPDAIWAAFAKSWEPPVSPAVPPMSLRASEPTALRASEPTALRASEPAGDGLLPPSQGPVERTRLAGAFVRGGTTTRTASEPEPADPPQPAKPPEPVEPPQPVEPPEPAEPPRPEPEPEPAP